MMLKYCLSLWSKQMKVKQNIWKKLYDVCIEHAKELVPRHMKYVKLAIIYVPFNLLSLFFNHLRTNINIVASHGRSQWDFCPILIFIIPKQISKYCKIIKDNNVLNTNSKFYVIICTFWFIQQNYILCLIITHVYKEKYYEQSEKSLNMFRISESSP